MKCARINILTLLALSIGYASILVAAPIGSPRSISGQGLWSFGIDYSYTNMDLEVKGTQYEEQTITTTRTLTKDLDATITDMDSHALFCVLSYGLHDHWDVFVRLGASNSQGNLDISQYTAGGTPETVYLNGGERFEFSNQFDTAFGLGIRGTFWENQDFSFGISAQMTWLNPKTEGTETWTDPNPSHDITITGITDTKLSELLIAAGPTINLGDLWVYGGPMISVVDAQFTFDGEFDNATQTGNLDADLETDTEIRAGGFVGAQWNLVSNVYCFSEIQVASDMWGFALGGCLQVE